MTPHPGRTKAERAALDKIGCGDRHPFAWKSPMRDRMLKAGLIVEIAPLILPGRFTIRIRQFDMPISVHMQWCKAIAEEQPQ